MKKYLVMFGLAILVACSGSSPFPRVGPSRGEILGSSVANGGNSYIIDVNESVAKFLGRKTGYGFPSSFFGSGAPSYETIKTGDRLQITVWENSDNGVFASLGSRVTQLSPMRVNENGDIFVPYVGKLKATGRTSEQLRREVTNKLAPQTPDPQVEIQHSAGRRGGVLLFSNTGTGGRIPFNEGNLTLVSFIAQNGGVGGDPLSTAVTLSRNGTSGTILANDLFENTRYDVPLRNNDRVTIERDKRYFRMLGSGGSQSLRRFSRPELSILDVIAEGGGLRATQSDPTGIFVFRTLEPAEANALLGGTELGRNHFTKPEQFIFVVNLSKPDGIFLAEKFMIEDRDTIYLTEAPFVTWMRLINTLTRTVGAVDSIVGIQDTVEGWTE